MMNRRHLYVGHMFSNGLTILDAADPRRLKPVAFFTGGDFTRTHHLQVADDLLLLANGANIVAMQSYDNLRSYFENALADSITNRKKFRSGLSIHDISRPAEMKEIAFLEMPGLGINRLWWAGGRYAYVAAHFDGFTDHILCVVDLRDVTKPEIVSRWWLPGMNRGGGRSRQPGPGTPRGAAPHDHGGQPRVRRLARRRVHGARSQRSGQARSSSLTSTGRRRFQAARTPPCRCLAGICWWLPTRPTPRSAPRARSTRGSWTCERRSTR